MRKSQEVANLFDIYQLFYRARQTVNQPIGCASRKIGLYWLMEPLKGGKECLTEFQLIHYSPTSNTSVVKCWPRTGRTHQIRIHLQFLGHPIVNDPLYNQPSVWGAGNGQGGLYEFDRERIEENFLKIHTYEAWIVKQLEREQEQEQEEQEDLSSESGAVKRKVEMDGDGGMVVEVRKIRKQEEDQSTSDG